MSEPWPILIRLAEIDGAPVALALEPDAPTRARIAQAIGVDALRDLRAQVVLRAWLDGAELEARVSAVAIQTCGLSLEPFEAPLEVAFALHVLPAGSPNAPPDQGPEIAIDPEAEDPPDMLESDAVDVGGYLVEHLALQVDLFPRKPGAVFEPPGDAEIISPFAALAALKGRRQPQ